MHTHTRHGIGAVAAVLLLAGGLVACGQESGEDPAQDVAREQDAAEDTAGDAAGDTEQDTEQDEEGEETAGEDVMGEGPEVTTADTELGAVLVDGQGMTLYLFTQDSPGQSACEGECLEAWPPLEGEPVAGEGVDEALLGSIERSDGTVQASYADWPLYYFAQDAEPGDVTGQGVNDVWWVLDPSGEPVETMPGEGGSGGGRDY